MESPTGKAPTYNLLIRRPGSKMTERPIAGLAAEASSFWKSTLYLSGRVTLLGSFVIGCGERFSDRKEARNGLRWFKAVDSDCRSVFLLCFPAAKPLGSGASQCTRTSRAADIGRENRP